MFGEMLHDAGSVINRNAMSRAPGWLVVGPMMEVAQHMLQALGVLWPHRKKIEPLATVVGRWRRSGIRFDWPRGSGMAGH